MPLVQQFILILLNLSIPGSDKFGGYYEWMSNDTTLNGLAPKNPLGLLNQQENISEVDRFIGNVQLDYKFHFLPDLHANFNVGLDHSEGKGTNYVPETAASSYTIGGNRSQYSEKKDNKLMEFYLNYAKDITSINSRVDVTAGYTYQDWKTTAPSFASLNARGEVLTPAGTPTEYQNTLISFYGRINLNFLDRYLITGTMRRDGSSRFGPENRWGNFPSVAAAWNLNNESFLKGNDVFSTFKIRVGWGITGQQDVGSNYGYQSNIYFGDSAARYQFGNNFITVARPAAYDANLKWEETESRNIGLDLGFMNNKILFTADYYNKSTRDLLVSVPTAAGTNFSNELLTNLGTVKNQGLELGVILNMVQNQDFSLNIGTNFTYIIQNEITRLQLVKDPNYLGSPSGYSGFNFIQINTVGYQPRTFFMYKQVYDKAGNPIEGLYEDRNRDGIINEQDKYWTKNPEPKVYVGFSLNTSYKKLSGGFTMRGAFDNYAYNGVATNAGIRQNILTGQGYLNNGHVDIFNTDFNSRQTWSDYYLENASFFRMDNAYVSYNVGSILKDKANLSVNFNVSNVFVITKYSGLDPELQSQSGIDNTIYPRPRTFGLGLNLGF